MSPDPSRGAQHELSFSVDLAQFDAEPMQEVSLAEAGIRERADLQRWIESYPEIVGRDLLLITTEFDQWQLRDRRVPDRLDVLFLDSSGSLLVAELKRDVAPDTTELQALKYAAYCSQLTVPDVTEQYARHHGVASEEARAALLEHAPALAAQELGPIRVRLVANGFGPSVTHVVLFLIDHGLDIGCIEVTARRHGASHVVLTSRQILPPPAAEDYLVKRRRREQEEEVREATARRRNSVTVLDEAAAIPAGTDLQLNRDAFTPDQRARFEQQAGISAGYATARWTGRGIREALRWNHDGELYSCSGLIWKILTELGFSPGSVPGPDYWLAPSGRTLYYEAVAVEDAARSGDPADGSP